jgi:hypothetical protein
MRTSELRKLMAMVVWAAVGLVALSACAAQADRSSGKAGKTATGDASGWVPLFDGKTLDGWHVGTKTGHGTGGRWVVEDGAIVGSQDKPGNGGILLTDRSFGNFEVALEMNNDFGPDSGLFLRSNEKGQCYQALIDYHNDGGLMGVYGEGIGGFWVGNFRLGDSPDKIEIVEHKPFPCPFTPAEWKKLWKVGQWNELRARIIGNPPEVQTWINGVKIMQWKDTQFRLPQEGMIALQVHGGGDFTKQFVRYRNVRVRSLDNVLTNEEKAAGWQLLFDGKTLKGWMTDRRQPSKRPVEDGAINPHRCGGYMMVHEKQWGDFVLSLDFKISKGCNSGIFLRTNPLESRPGKSVGYNGLEVAIDDTTGAGYHDTGAIFDLVKPARNAMRPVGEWNHIVITCDKNLITVELNGDKVTKMDLDEWTDPNHRPDGTRHKYDWVWKTHPRRGYIGLQDHGSDCWFKNIKLRPLDGK